MSDNVTKRGPGRPPLGNPLSPAERAKRYRARKARSVEAGGPSSTGFDEKYLLSRLFALQMKYDLEHQSNTQLTHEIAMLREATTARSPDPAQRKIETLQRTIGELEKIISGYSAEINRLNDIIAAVSKTRR